MDPKGEGMRPTEVALELGVSLATVYRWDRIGKPGFPRSIKLSPTVKVFSRREIMAYKRRLMRDRMEELMRKEAKT